LLGRPALAAHAQLPCYGDARIDLDFAQALRAFRAELPILLAGETGTGKDITARALHQAGAASSGPFVALNCASIPSELLAGELFGHVDGAYTGSRRGGAPGKVEAAHGGTLFLDEIGDMPLQLQALLLRVLDSKEVVRLGDTQVRPVDIRVVCATHRDLRACVAQGRFREDLYYRVAGHEMTLLPLRERTDFDALLDTLLQVNGASPDRVPADIRSALRSRAWPGNVRQLALTVRRALALVDPSDTLELADFGKADVVTQGGPTPRTTQVNALGNEDKLLQRAQHQAISQAMAATSGNVTAAAALLGMGRATLYRKLRSTASSFQEHTPLQMGEPEND
jgi:transcriptional regulator with PAS, ATPase and Fis domain